MNSIDRIMEDEEAEIAMNNEVRGAKLLKQRYCGVGRFRLPCWRVFNVACLFHDKDYTHGGYSLDRMLSDVRFLKQMMLMAYDYKGFKKVYLQTWAVLYFIVVRIFGKLFFNYKITR